MHFYENIKEKSIIFPKIGIAYESHEELILLSKRFALTIIASIIYIIGCCSNLKEREKLEQISTMCSGRHQETSSRAFYFGVPNQRTHQRENITTISSGNEFMTG